MPSSDVGRPTLSIGEVAERTGLTPAALRRWEIRYGFPAPVLLDGTERRYDAGQVDTLLDVLRRQESGERLDQAIEQVVRAAGGAPAPGPMSIYAEVRRQHPWLHPQRLRKSTLIALSWAIEDEFCSRAHGAHLFGAFQKERYWRPARDRWAELARSARSAHVFADVPEASDDGHLVVVPLEDAAPLRAEWAVVCDAPGLAAALSAWEVPGQTGVPERDRIFESVWTIDPVAVRDAARVCARVAAGAGADDGMDLELALVGPVLDTKADLAYVTAVFNRVVAYVDHFSD